VTADPPATLPPSSRLRKRAEYRAVYDQGRRIPAGHLVLFVLEQELGFPRIGITATRRVGSAVRRNRARRLVKEAFRRHRTEIASWDIVVNVKPSAVECHFGEIERDFLDALRRARRGRQGRGGTGR
jgi:ribonuclease P protein component